MKKQASVCTRKTHAPPQTMPKGYQITHLISQWHKAKMHTPPESKTNKVQAPIATKHANSP